MIGFGTPSLLRIFNAFAIVYGDTKTIDITDKVMSREGGK